MEANKDLINNLNLFISIVFITSIITGSFSNLSFAKENNYDKENAKGFKQYTLTSYSVDKEMDIIIDDYADEMKEKSISNNISSSSNSYPDHFYFCGYPIHIISDHYFFEKFNDCEIS